MVAGLAEDSVHVEGVSGVQRGDFVAGGGPLRQAEGADAAAKSPVKARSWTICLYRHWNNYVGPKRSHVLVVSATDGNAVRDLTPRAGYWGCGGADVFAGRADGVCVGSGLEGDCLCN